jgi:hypothetical protein
MIPTDGARGDIGSVVVAIGFVGLLGYMMFVAYRKKRAGGEVRTSELMAAIAIMGAMIGVALWRAGVY